MHLRCAIRSIRFQVDSRRPLLIKGGSLFVSTMETLQQHILLVLELLGTAAFAISGVLVALRKRMDVVGICVCGFLAAFGGGTLRDVLIDKRPFFWAEHQMVLLAVLLLCMACKTRHQVHQQGWLLWAGGLGLLGELPPDHRLNLNGLMGLKGLHCT